MIMNAENDRYHIPPQKAAEGAGQKDETHLALALHRRLTPAAASSRSYSAAVSSLGDFPPRGKRRKRRRIAQIFFRRVVFLLFCPEIILQYGNVAAVLTARQKKRPGSQKKTKPLYHVIPCSVGKWGFALC